MLPDSAAVETFVIPLELGELELYERWRYVRVEVLDVTQKAFALEMGVNVRTVKGWEHPDLPRGVPTEANARRVVEIAGRSGLVLPWELFTSPMPAESSLLREINRKLDLVMAHLGIEDE